MHDNSAAIINRRLIYGNEKWVTPTDSGCHRWRHVWSRTALRHRSSLRLLLEANPNQPQLQRPTTALHVLPSSSSSTGSSVIRWTRIRWVPRPCIQPFVRIRSRCTRCTRTAAGCFTDSTIAIGYSTIGVPDRSHSDFTVSLSWELSADYTVV